MKQRMGMKETGGDMIRTLDFPLHPLPPPILDGISENIHCYHLTEHDCRFDVVQIYFFSN